MHQSKILDTLISFEAIEGTGGYEIFNNTGGRDG